MTTPTNAAPAHPAGPATVPADGRLSASIDAWKRRLLDLSKRNRALNFRATRVSTVAVVDEHPAELFRALYLSERELRFQASEQAVPEAAQVTDAGSVAASDAPDAETHPAPAAPPFAPYDAATLDDRHTDDYLQTTATTEALDRSLRRLDEQA